MTESSHQQKALAGISDEGFFMSCVASATPPTGHSTADA
jgi:hypothetical protein